LHQDLVPRDDPLWQLYLAVRNFTTPTGNELAEAFLSLPSRYCTALWQLYLAVRNFTMPTGNELAEAFLSLPSRYSTVAALPGGQELHHAHWQRAGRGLPLPS
jgi:hypothetical protein